MIHYDMYPLPLTDQKPTMPELISFQGKTEHINIPQQIGLDWRMVGVLLLNDKDGKIVSAIASQYSNDDVR